jgi:hypothetical protein
MDPFSQLCDHRRQTVAVPFVFEQDRVLGVKLGDQFFGGGQARAGVFEQGDEDFFEVSHDGFETWTLRVALGQAAQLRARGLEQLMAAPSRLLDRGFDRKVQLLSVFGRNHLRGDSLRAAERDRGCLATGHRGVV